MPKLIARANDKNKDQSYFLWQIKKEQIEKILFPIGEFENKAEVRQRAEELDLITAKKADSQGLCFVGQTSLRQLLIQSLGSKEGDIIDQSGQILGKHPGAFLYTIGQRSGLGLSGGPWFVQKIDIDKNLVIVTHQIQTQSLFSQKLRVINTNWQKLSRKMVFDCQGQIRYRQNSQNCRVKILSNNQAEVDFFEPVKAAAIGQSIVFYNEDCMLGGALIDSILKEN